MRTEIISWIKDGCSLEKGIELFSKYGYNEHFLRLCKLQPKTNEKMLVYQLCQLAKLSEKDFNRLKKVERKPKSEPTASKKANPKPIVTDLQSRKFRDEFPFLRDPTCPHELKILAADKITAYHNYIEGHKKLFDCCSIDDCTNTAREVVENYMDNRLIWEELNYYKEHGSCLGKHPIFKLRKRFESLKEMNVRELLTLHDKSIPHKIWRIKSEMKKGDKPHLDSERRRRLQENEAELAEIKRVLSIDK